MAWEAIVSFYAPFIELTQNYEEIGPRILIFDFAFVEYSTIEGWFFAPVTAGGHGSAVMFTTESEISMLS